MKSIFYLAGFLIVMNIIGFASMGIDKKRAQRSAFRIPEATLFAIALIGGSLGSILGMRVFHHKTKHWYFKFGMPLILILQILAALLLYFSPLEFKFM
ncbi:MAG: DUF1294 domain-containing protein [Butyrivibrio sp.]|jgi:uncharacterized membrane protein YsdA (DUF1294 family)|nr:DUF1294 domain-containing protein [Butyrivibrio sp.]MBP3814503.1 DUF1294 domain-containing protein [Butyrivibrio sp.]MBQ8031850.1 DUF1294 domain-containing protein [Butyrivibrio sp.]